MKAALNAIRLLASLSLLAVAVPLAGATAPTPQPGGHMLRVTTPATKTAVAMHVGERLTVAYGDELEWTGRSSNPAVLAPVMGLALRRGVQGVYLAKAAGRATLTFTGRARSQPGAMHPTFIRLARIDVTVTR